MSRGFSLSFIFASSTPRRHSESQSTVHHRTHFCHHRTPLRHYAPRYSYVKCMEQCSDVQEQFGQHRHPQSPFYDVFVFHYHYYDSRALRLSLFLHHTICVCVSSLRSARKLVFHFLPFAFSWLQTNWMRMGENCRRRCRRCYCHHRRHIVAIACEVFVEKLYKFYSTVCVHCHIAMETRLNMCALIYQQPSSSTNQPIF